MAYASDVYIFARSYEELPQTLVPAEIALLCSATQPAVSYWLTRGKLKARKAGRIWLIDKRDLLSFAKKRQIVLSYYK